MERNLLDKKANEEKQKKYFENIANMIFTKVNLGLPFNENFLYDLLDLSIEHYDLKEYITTIENNSWYSDLSIVFLNPITKGIQYSFLKRKVQYNQTIFEESVFIPRNLKGLDLNFYQYLYKIWLVLKAIENSKQLKSFEKKEDTLQNKILEMSYFKYLTMYQKYISHQLILNSNRIRKQWEHRCKTFNQYTFHAPEERNAHLASLETILEIVELLKLEEIEHILKMDLYNILLNTYNMYSIDNEDLDCCPTWFYLRELVSTKKEEKKLEKLLQQAENLEVNERLKLGLTLTTNELYKARKCRSERKNTKNAIIFEFLKILCYNEVT